MTKAEEATPLEGDPLWFKDAIFYELHVRAFHDSANDGVGDFKGLSEKLDYLQELGITALWLLPFYPSPLKDDGYDISHYTDVHRSYGTLRDFQAFLKEAHRRGIRVITELVLNHTSDQHPWFRRARRSGAESPWRRFYVWSDTPAKYPDARIIFKDFELSNWTWDPVAKAYYWHRFYSHQPDLNYESAQVRQAILRVVNFWLGMGVDGLRLDAVPYLCERDGSNCENLPETHAFLKELRRHVDRSFKGRVLLAEANQWPEEAVSYFGSGDECHMAYHFPLMPRLFLAVRMEDRFPLVDVFNQTPPIPETSQWALFLRNHDELTLEMVTDEERDYMYRVYATEQRARINLGIRRRLAPLLGNNRRKIELLNALLFSLPGTPFIYYGEEIGMGDNIYLGDRNSVRTPMQWSADRNAGFSRANSQSLYLPVVIDPEFHYETVNVEAQERNPSSLLWWMKRLIAHRKRFKAFGRGSMEFLRPENRKILAFVRRHKEESILVLANLSRFVEQARVDLSAFKGLVPVEVFGGAKFPPIGDSPVDFTFGPHSFYWFDLQKPHVPEFRSREPEPAVLEIATPGDWTDAFKEKYKGALCAALLSHAEGQSWFAAKKVSPAKSASILDSVPHPGGGPAARWLLVQFDFEEGEAKVFLLPVACAAREDCAEILEKFPHSVIARLVMAGEGATREGVMYDSLASGSFCRSLLSAMEHRRRFKGQAGEIITSPRRLLRSFGGAKPPEQDALIRRFEKVNTSVVYADRLVFKFFREVERGAHPDFETVAYLTEKVSFPHVAPVVGSMEYVLEPRDPADPTEHMVLGLLHGFIPNEGDAWQYTLDALGRYYERVMAQQVKPTPEAIETSREPVWTLGQDGLPQLACETLGAFLPSVQLLGQRAAELHLALASRPDEPNFAPEPFSKLFQRSLYQSLRNLTGRVFEALGRYLDSHETEHEAEARKVLSLQNDILKRFWAVHERKITARRIRCHGDLHLGKILRAGKDFVFIDFEGEPYRSLSERRLKRSPLRDVASLIRSFHNAAYTALYMDVAGGVFRPEDIPALEPRARMWNYWVSMVFLRSYFEACGQTSFLPATREETLELLQLYYLERLVFELGYELLNRPERLFISLRGILRATE